MGAGATRDAVTSIAGRPWLVPIAADAEADREAWEVARLEGIGGSDAAAIVGEHPHRGAIDVWMERVSGSVLSVDHERTEVGRLLEPTVLGWYEAGAPAWPRGGGRLTVVKPPTVYHRDRPWQRGSADGLVFLPEALEHLWAERGDLSASDVVQLAPASALDHLVEVKSHGWMGGRAYDAVLGEDGSPVDIPADKRIQCAWYMALYDVPRCRLLCLVDTHLRRTLEVERDRELEASLLEEVETFWTSYVVTGEMPPPDGSESYRRHLGERFRKHRPELIASTPDIDAAIGDLVGMKAEEKALKQRIEAAEQIVKAHIGDAAGVMSALGACTWKAQASGKLKLREALSELYSVAGWTDDEIAAFEARHALPDVRVFRTPKPRKR